MNTGISFAYGVDAPMAGIYTTSLRYRLWSAPTTSCTFQVYLNGVLNSTQTVPGTNNAMANWVFPMTLPAGFSAIRLKIISGGFAVATHSFTLPDVTNGLMARWNFDGNTTDTSPSGSVADNGTLVGNPSYVTLTGSNVPVGTGAITLDGTTQCMSVPNSTDLNLTSAYSITAWVKIANATESAYRMIVSKRVAGTDTTGYELMYGPALNTLVLRSGGGYATFTVNQPLDLDTNWHHLAVTVSGSTAKVYEDGVLLTGATGSIGNPIANTQGVAVGRRSGATDFPWNGQLDDVRIYNRALSASEIDTIFIQEH